MGGFRRRGFERGVLLLVARPAVLAPAGRARRPAAAARRCGAILRAGRGLARPRPRRELPREGRPAGRRKGRRAWSWDRIRRSARTSMPTACRSPTRSQLDGDLHGVVVLDLAAAGPGEAAGRPAPAAVGRGLARSAAAPAADGPRCAGAGARGGRPRPRAGRAGAAPARPAPRWRWSTSSPRAARPIA